MPAGWSWLCLQLEAAHDLLLHAWGGARERLHFHPFPSFIQHLLGTYCVPALRLSLGDTDRLSPSLTGQLSDRG